MNPHAPKGAPADVLGISENIARRHYAKWSAARQERISTIMRLVRDGETGAAAMIPQITKQKAPLLQ